jgi:hypothetical protein
LLLSLYFGCTTNHRSISFGYLLISIRFYVSGVFIDEEVDGIGDKGSGHTTTAAEWALLEAFMNCSQDLPVSFFPLKIKLLLFGLLSLSAGLPVFPNYWTSN